MVVELFIYGRAELGNLEGAREILKYLTDKEAELLAIKAISVKNIFWSTVSGNYAKALDAARSLNNEDARAVQSVVNVARRLISSSK